MKFLIATHNLTEENCHLMPWRAVCEVTNHLQNMGQNVTLVSFGVNKGEIPSNRLPQGTREIRKSYDHIKDDLRDLFALETPSVVFWPIAWREPRRRIRIVGDLGIPLVGYFAGGCYSFTSTLYASKRIGFRAALPYIFESLSPKSRQVKVFRENGFRRMIAITEMTAESAANAGWPKKSINVIPPGRDEEPIGLKASDLPRDFVCWLGKRPYYLFSGPPGAIRGIYELLEAFNTAAEKHQDICLVTLFRSVAPLEAEKIRARVNGLSHRDRVYTVWKSLEKKNLDSFISNCHAVVLPFVLVPSEIPLTIIESMAWGKPVITTVPSGTGEFVRRFGAVARIGDVNNLAQIMVDLVNDQTLYSEKCKVTLEKYKNHPTWKEVALEWLEVGKSVISA